MACITPAHLYREHLAEKIIKEKIPSNSYFLEIGCGTGDFSLELVNYGFSGIAIDFSEAAIMIAKKKLKNANVKVISRNLFKFEHEESFDVVFMFEVLEHIEDDQEALKKIFYLLKPHGRLLFSVPAHQKMFGRDDKWGGHYRRYEKQDLIRLLNSSGFSVEIFWCYGFPAFNFTRWTYNLLCRLGKKKENKISKIKKTDISGLNKEGADIITKTKWLYPYLSPIFRFSDLFLNSDLGGGYICYCRKRKT